MSSYNINLNSGKDLEYNLERAFEVSGHEVRFVRKVPTLPPLRVQEKVLTFEAPLPISMFINSYVQSSGRRSFGRHRGTSYVTLSKRGNDSPEQI